MVTKLLKKIHQRIFLLRLKEAPSICHPWQGDFVLDVPEDVFEVLLNKVINRNSFGHTEKETNAFIEVSVTDVRKIVYILDRQNMEGEVVAKSDIACKKGDGKRVTKLVVSEAKPFLFKFHKSKETLKITFYYGHWNTPGLPQH